MLATQLQVPHGAAVMPVWIGVGDVVAYTYPYWQNSRYHAVLGAVQQDPMPNTLGLANSAVARCTQLLQDCSAGTTSCAVLEQLVCTMSQHSS